jgi:hypothetical protein
VNPRYASDLLCRKNGGRFAPGTEWAHDHISAVLAKLTTQYKAMLLQRKVDIKTQVLEAEQAHAFAVEEYKEILAAAITERKLKEHRVSS